MTGWKCILNNPRCDGHLCEVCKSPMDGTGQCVVGCPECGKSVALRDGTTWSCVSLRLIEDPPSEKTQE